MESCSGIPQCDIALECLLTFWIMCLQGAVGLVSMIIVRFACFDLNAYLSALELHLWEARANTLVLQQLGSRNVAGGV